MLRHLWLLCLLSSALLLAACTPLRSQPSVLQTLGAFAVCPITRVTAASFTPPAPYPAQPPGEYFWYGAESLWTALPQNGIWSDLPHNRAGYTQKVLWWRQGYSWTAEPKPALTVTGRRLDAAAPPLNVAPATNAYAEDIQSAMLVGVDFPTLGCWELTGRYADAELRFVVWVAPRK